MSKPIDADFFRLHRDTLAAALQFGQQSAVLVQMLLEVLEAQIKKPAFMALTFDQMQKLHEMAQGMDKLNSLLAQIKVYGSDESNNEQWPEVRTSRLM